MASARIKIDLKPEETAWCKTCRLAAPIALVERTGFFSDAVTLVCPQCEGDMVPVVPVEKGEDA